MIRFDMPIEVEIDLVVDMTAHIDAPASRLKPAQIKRREYMCHVSRYHQLKRVKRAVRLKPTVRRHHPLRRWQLFG